MACETKEIIFFLIDFILFDNVNTFWGYETAMKKSTLISTENFSWE